MNLISVKLYGRYYNVEASEGKKTLAPKQAVQRAVRLKKLGKDYSGPAEAKAALPKPKAKIQAKKGESNANTHSRSKGKK